ncbi:MAG: hypothetical protein LN590_06475 [Rickettsia endosymbiont of Glossina mortisans submortisans]|nr:hypothetical protein [Rickettsia endosymbiont of Glossina mortisans submortisans]
MKSKIPTELNIKSLTEEETALDSLKENILNGLTEVNYSLIQAGKTSEATVVIGLPYSGKSTFLNALENNLKIIENGEEFTFDKLFDFETTPEIKHKYEPTIYYPKKFEIAEKVFWEYSNGVPDPVQELINVFFIKKLVQMTDKLKFIIVTKEETVKSPSIFNRTIEDFKKFFPLEEYKKLKGNFTCVITQHNENNHENIISMLQNSIASNKDILESSEIKFFYKPTSQDEEIKLTLELKDLEEIAGVQNLEMKNLSSFLKEQDSLIENLYIQIQINVEYIINTIQSIFRDFNISTSLNCVKFSDNNNYDENVKPYLPSSSIQYPAIKKTLSYFEGLTQLSELQTIISNKQDNNLIEAIFQILDSIEKFTDNNQVIQAYRYVLNLRIKELSLFEEMLPTTWSRSNDCYSSLIEICDLFVQNNYLSSIKNMKPENNKPVQYYQEAIKWLSKYPDKTEVIKTIASCYSKIGDILSEEADYKGALANYNAALTCNEELKEMYDKIGDMLFNLGREDSAIIFYRKNNKLDSILECYTSLTDKAEKPIKKYDSYMDQGNELRFQKQQEADAAESYFKAASVVHDPQKQHNSVLTAYNTFLGNPNNNAIQQTDISEQQQRKEYFKDIIGDIIDP